MRAIDDDFNTRSWTTTSAGTDQWIELTLDEAHCVYQVVVYYYAERDTEVTMDATTFTCTQDSCTCDGAYCWWPMSLEVTGAGGGDSDCKNGNTLTLSFTGTHGISFTEIAVYEQKRKKHLRFK